MIKLASMYSKNEDLNSLIFNRLHSSDWGIWGKEKYTYDELEQKEKHEKEKTILGKLLKGAPERLKVALRYSYGICDLKAYARPISEEEFVHLSRIYNDALAYTAKITDAGFRELIMELFFIHQTAKEIPEFTNGALVNETDDESILRKYVYLDFFKFSSINRLMRESLDRILEYTDEVLTARLTLAWFLGTGSFVEKAGTMFSDEANDQIKKLVQGLCKRIEINPEFPDILYGGYWDDYIELLDLVRSRRNKKDHQLAVESLSKRYEAFEICEAYYKSYFELSYVSNKYLIQNEKPLKLLVKLYDDVLKSDELKTSEVLNALRTIRALVDEKYDDPSLFSDEFLMKDFFVKTNHPFFQALLYEGKILRILFESDHPGKEHQTGTLFEELIPFYAGSYKKRGQLFSFEKKPIGKLPKLALVHHVHNANCEKLYHKMIINRLTIWDSEKISFQVASSSSNAGIAIKEREYCLKSGFNHYRIHARHHLKAGNQNRTVTNVNDGIGNEYYLTLDDDYFAFPDFVIQGHQEIEAKNLDYYQAPLSFKGMYDRVTLGEQVDAEMMHFFEVTYGQNYPRIYSFPRGTSTIFSFTDGQNSISDTGGFLVDFSCEDFGQGYLSLIQHHSSVLGKRKCDKSPGEMASKVYVIGEGVDLTGKVRQVERWSHGHSKVLFHLLIPVVVKSLLKGETGLIMNKQFLMTFGLTSFGIIYRIMSFAFLCLPFIYNSWYNSGEGVYFQHMLLLNVMIVFNFILVFVMFFYSNGKASFSPLRLIAIETILSIPSLKGHLKGILGLKPDVWRADKSKRFSNTNFIPIYGMLLLNLFSLLTLKHLNAGLIFWALFNITILGGGIIMFGLYKKPKDPRVNLVGKFSFNAWLELFLISIAFNVIFFVLESKTFLNGLKLMMLCILLYSFFSFCRTMLFNLIIIWKEDEKMMESGIKRPNA